MPQRWHSTSYCRLHLWNTTETVKNTLSCTFAAIGLAGSAFVIELMFENVNKQQISYRKLVVSEFEPDMYFLLIFSPWSLNHSTFCMKSYSKYSKCYITIYLAPKCVGWGWMVACEPRKGDWRRRLWYSVHTISFHEYSYILLYRYFSPCLRNAYYTNYNDGLLSLVQTESEIKNSCQ